MTDVHAHQGIDEAIADVEEQLGVLLSRIRLIWKESACQIHPELRASGYKILSTIVRLGEANPSMLADLLETDKAVVSRQVRILEEAGLVVSCADDRDGRSRVLSPTALAVERVSAVRGQQQDRLRELLRGRPEPEVQQFVGMLRLINEL